MRSTPWVPLLLGLAVAAAAEPDLAELERGCLECHNDPSRGALPLLEGQHADYLTLQLRHFREQHRDAWPMRTIAEGLNASESAALAARLAARPWRDEGHSGDPRRRAEGAAIAARFECASCHGEDYTGAGVVPRTAGQRAPYLARQLAEFADGRRFHPPTGTGARMYRLGEREAMSVALYLASLAPVGAAAGIDLGWMAGHWCGEQDGRATEEFWLAPRAGEMLGLRRESGGNQPPRFEFLRIEIDAGGATLYSQPGGANPATPFRLSEHGPGRAVFANPADDGPQRVLYARDGAALRAGRDGGPGTESRHWTGTRDCR